jgi:hypothetical protein
MGETQILPFGGRVAGLRGPPRFARAGSVLRSAFGSRVRLYDSQRRVRIGSIPMARQRRHLRL